MLQMKTLFYCQTLLLQNHSLEDTISMQFIANTIASLDNNELIIIQQTLLDNLKIKMDRCDDL